LFRIAAELREKRLEVALRIRMVDEGGLERVQDLGVAPYVELVLGRSRIERSEGLLDQSAREPAKREDRGPRRVDEELTFVEFSTALVIGRGGIEIDCIIRHLPRSLPRLATTGHLGLPRDVAPRLGIDGLEKTRHESLAEGENGRCSRKPPTHDDVVNELTDR